MTLQRSLRKLLPIGLLGAAIQLPAHAVDSVSLEVASASRTQAVRAGLQWDWSSKWWQSNGTHIGGYWDLSLGQWRATRFQNRDATQSITDLGFTPVFRFQRDDMRGLYGEFGIGAHYLTGLYDNNGKHLSTHFQFGDHIGIGYVFRNGLDLGLRYQHFSNGGYSEPNDGVNFVVLRLRYGF